MLNNDYKKVPVKGFGEMMCSKVKRNQESAVQSKTIKGRSHRLGLGATLEDIPELLRKKRKKEREEATKEHSRRKNNK